MTSLLEALACVLYLAWSWELVARATDQRNPAALLLRAALTWMLAAGIASIGLFVGLLLGATPRTRPWVEVAVLAAGTILLRCTRSPRSTPLPRPATTGHVWPWYVAALAALGFAAFTGLATWREAPLGNFDATEVWNQRARAFFHLGPDWRVAFRSAAGHSDYPLLLSCTVARGYFLAGGALPGVGALVAAVYTVATAALLFAATDRACGRRAGLGAVTALLAVPHFVEVGLWQYADVPLALGFLATAACIGSGIGARRPGVAWMVLAGCAAGVTLWTKNEGMLILIGLGVGYRIGVVPARQGDGRKLLALVLGLLPWVITFGLFKALVAWENDVVAPRRLQEMLGQLAHPSRYGPVLWGLVRYAWVSSHGVIPLFLLAGLGVWLGRCAGPGAPGVPGVARQALRWVSATLLCTLSLYLLVYVITYWDQQHHMMHSFSRLLMQLWPATVLVVVWRVGNTRSEAPRQEGAVVGPQHRGAGG